PPLPAQREQVRNHLGTEGLDRPSLEVGPARADQLAKMERRHALPVPLVAEGVVENTCNVLGERLLERSPRPAHGEGQAHRQPLSRLPDRQANKPRSGDRKPRSALESSPEGAYPHRPDSAQ